MAPTTLLLLLIGGEGGWSAPFRLCALCVLCARSVFSAPSARDPQRARSQKTRTVRRDEPVHGGMAV